MSENKNKATFHNKVFIRMIRDSTGEQVEQCYCEGTCMSDDIKPTGPEIFNGSNLLELDTGEVYFYRARHEVWRTLGEAE